MTRTVRHVLFVVVLLIAVAACGQKPGVSGQAVGAGGGGGVGAGGGGTGTGTGATGTGAAAGTAGGTAAGTAGAAGAGTDPAAAGTDPAAAGAGPAGPADRTGITDTEIVIGIHAPVTGAAPFPQNSFEAGKDIYFQFINDQGRHFHGASVRVVFRDDRFDPQTRRARRARRWSKRQRLPAHRRRWQRPDRRLRRLRQRRRRALPVRGRAESGLSELGGYFALSMTYAQQAPLLAQMIAKQFAGQSVAVVVAEGDNLDDYFASQLEALQRRGITPARPNASRRPPASPTRSTSPPRSAPAAPRSSCSTPARCRSSTSRGAAGPGLPNPTASGPASPTA